MAKKATKQVFAWSADGNVLTIKYPGCGRRLVFDRRKAPAEMRDEAERHGWKQKFGDAASGRSSLEKFEHASRVKESVLSGNWEVVGERDITPLVREALLRLGQPKKKVEAQSEEMLRALARNAAVRVEIRRIQLERAEREAAGAADELAELLGETDEESEADAAADEAVETDESETDEVEDADEEEAEESTE